MTPDNRPFRFVHTADLHLDSPLRSLASRDPGMAQAVRGASREAFERTIDLCLDEHVDALLIAGDLYDGDQRSMATAAFLRSQLLRLAAEQIRVFLIRGNHDAQSQLTSELALPSNVHTFDGRGSTVHLDEHRVAVHGVSYRKQKAPESLLPRYPKPVPDYCNIGLLHTSLSGSGSHDTYAPCSLDELQGFGYDYWALGHIHKRAIWADAHPAVVMPGNPQGRHIGEDGARGVYLVELDDQSVTVQFHAVARARFERIDIDISDIDDWETLENRLETQLSATRDSLDTPLLILRLCLLGCSPIAWQLNRDLDRLEALLQTFSARLDGLWLEKIDNHVEHSGNARASAATNARREQIDTETVVDELEALIDGELLRSPELRQHIHDEATELLKKLPDELRHCLGDDVQTRETRLDDLRQRGTRRLLAELHR